MDTMKFVVDYQIVQRGADGCAQVSFGGALPPEHAGKQVWARAVREDDTLEICPWQRCEAADGLWQTVLTLPAGGPYWLEARALGEGDTLDWGPRIKRVSHVGVGELYMLAGQSNMAGYGRDAAYDPPELGVHLYGNNGCWSVAAHPLNDSVDTIYPENAEHASNTSPALSFARMLRRRLGVPVGLVQASLGGSPLSRWHPEETGDLYRAMLRRLDAVGQVGGVLWYQGCTDTDTEEWADGYLSRFKRMVELWRADLGDVPIVTVQINRVKQGAPDDAHDRRWARVREAQRRAALEIDRLVVVPANDLACTDGIHNSSGSNVILGERMAHAALKAFYGQPGLAAPNLRRAVRVDATHLYLEFGPGFTLRMMDGRDTGLDVEDAQGTAHCVSGVPCEGGIVLTTEREFTLPARFGAYWQAEVPPFIARDLSGMPMLSCYGVPVEG